MRAGLLAVLLLAGPVGAQTPPAAESTTTDEDRAAEVEDMTKQLESDQGLREALAQRVLRSRIGGTISTTEDENKRLQEIAEWVKTNPGSAAEIAIGLARDDASGKPTFENNMMSHMTRKYGDRKSTRLNSSHQ